MAIIILVVLFQLQDKLRKPLYSRVHNVWNEDKDSVLMANAIIVTMLFIAFILGMHI